MQHKKSVLFLISLSQSKIQEIEEKGVNYELFLKTIHGYTHVEIHETISEELINKASLYNVVVVVGHQVNECIEMPDGSLFPMNKIAQALPAEFNGYLHVAVCGSSSIRDEIKRRCPDSRVRTSNRATQLELQILIYSQLLSRTDLCKETFDYWYEFHRNYIKEIQKRKSPEELATLPWASTLGEPTTAPIPTVYSPNHVIRGYEFEIQIFLHYDTEKGIVHDIAIGRDHETKPHLIPETLKDIQKGDEVEIRLSMQDVKSNPTDQIIVCGKECTYSETITICDTFAEKVFDVIVCEEYKYEEFKAVVEFVKDGKSIIKPYKYKISFKQESSQKINNADLVDEIEGRKDFTGNPIIKTNILNEKVIMAMAKILKLNSIHRKQDWAVIYRVLYENSICYDRTQFVKQLRFRFGKEYGYCIPASSSSIDKFLCYLSENTKHPNWIFKWDTKDPEKAKSETERLITLAHDFLKYYREEK